jgi:putative transposase
VPEFAAVVVWEELCVGASLDDARDRVEILRMEPGQRPVRQTDNLHKGRISAAGALYFITMVAQDRKPWLADARTRGVTLAVLQAWHAEHQGAVLAATVMPDHIHVLFTLGQKLTVGQTIARWKSATRKEIGFTEDFQRDFWEHMLREAEDIEDYALYIFLNPYRAGLLPVGRSWPGWWAPEPDLFRFTAALDSNGSPPREWIDWPDERFFGLAHGE